MTCAALRVTWHHFFVAGAILQRHGLEKLQNEWVRCRQLRIQLSIIEGSLAELLDFDVASLKLRKQNCFVFDVVNFEKMKKSRRLVSFWTLLSSKAEEVSQTCFVFDVVNFEK